MPADPFQSIAWIQNAPFKCLKSEIMLIFVIFKLKICPPKLFSQIFARLIKRLGTTGTQVVKADGSSSRGHEFKPQYHILDGCKR
jgi:hypothetical protein